MATSITTIQSTDLITNSRADINNNFDSLLVNKIETDVLTTDSTFATASDSKIPSQLAVKQYVDAGGNVNASTTTKGIVELATAAEIDAGTATGGTGAALVVTADALKGSLAPIVRTYLNAGSPHTWTKPAGLKYIVVEVQGAGGGSGGVTDSDDGSGAGAGGYSRKLIGTASLGTTETVTVGAAGTAGASGANDGGNGGNTSFGSHCSANGGTGSLNSGGTAGSGGTATGGDINITGQAGGKGGGNGGTSGGPDSGFGGSSILGIGGQMADSGGGLAGSGYGAGAGGARTPGGADYAGAAGTQGIVILTEYYV